MTHQIRHNVFETNSSSSHSLTMSEGDVVALPFSKDILRDGTLSLSIGEYGWEWFRYYTTEGKAAYLLTQVVTDTEGRSTSELREAYAEIDMLCKVIKDHTGVDVRILESNGYIDHDSEGVGRELFRDENKLKHFLFSDTSFIETSNDNDQPPKMISTDKGDAEHYYSASYATVPKGSVGIQVKLEGWSHTKPVTPEGAELDPESAFWKQILAEGVVTRAEWQTSNKYDPFKYYDTTSYTMAQLADDELGLKFLEDLQIVNTRNPELSDSQLTVTIMVPKAVAATYKELI